MQPRHILTYKLEELLGEKIRSLIERGKSRDYYDVWSIFKYHIAEINRELLKDVFKRKLEHKGITVKGIDDFFPVDSRVVEAYWTKELGYQVRNLAYMDQVFKQLRSYLSETLNM